MLVPERHLHLEPVRGNLPMLTHVCEQSNHGQRSVHIKWHLKSIQRRNRVFIQDTGSLVFVQEQQILLSWNGPSHRVYQSVAGDWDFSQCWQIC